MAVSQLSGAKGGGNGRKAVWLSTDRSAAEAEAMVTEAGSKVDVKGQLEADLTDEGTELKTVVE